VNKILRIVFCFAVLGVIYIANGNSSGPSWTYTSAPNEGTCQSCHTTYSLQTSGKLHDKISLRLPMTGGYLPDSTYTFLLVFRDSLNAKAGFQMTSLDGTNSPAGTFATVDSRTQIGSSVIGGKTRRYVGHTSTGNSHQSTDSISWRIKWTAPSTNVGAVKFYFNVVSANGNGGNNGDYVFSKTLTINPSNLLPTAKAKLNTSLACAGSSLSFAATTTGSPTNYEWTFGGGSPSISTLATPNSTFNNSGAKSIFLRVKNAFGYSAYDTLNLNILQSPFLPTISPVNMGLLQKCASDIITLKTTKRSGESYIWMPDSIRIDTFNAFLAKDYSVRARLGNGCIRESSPVRVMNYPISNFTIKKISSDTLCKNVDSIRFKIESGSKFSQSFVIHGSDTFGQGKTTFIMPPSNIAGLDSFKVYARDSNNCEMTEKIVKFYFKDAHSAPVLIEGTRGLDFITARWRRDPKIVAYEITDNNGNTGWVPTGNNGTDTFYTFSGLSSGTVYGYKVRGVVFSQCLNSKSTIFTLDSTNECPGLSFTITSSLRFCKGNLANITIDGTTAPGYKFFVNNVLQNTPNKHTIVNQVNQSLKLTVTDSTEVCKFTRNASVVFDSTDIFTLNMPIIPVCMDRSVSSNLNLSVKPAKANNFNWFVNSDSVRTTSDTFVVLGLKHNDIVFTKIARGACTIYSDTQTVIFEDPLNCSFNTIRKTGGNFQLASNTKIGTHTWLLNGTTFGPSIDSFNYDFSALAGSSAKITHRLTQGPNCQCIDSTILDLSILSSQIIFSQGFMVYPNPSQSSFLIQTKSLANNIPFSLYDITGKIVIAGKHSGVSTEVFVSQLESGVYYLRLGLGQETAVIKLNVIH
jgi:hypothetical protein